MLGAVSEAVLAQCCTRELLSCILSLHAPTHLASCPVCQIRTEAQLTQQVCSAELSETFGHELVRLCSSHKQASDCYTLSHAKASSLCSPACYPHPPPLPPPGLQSLQPRMLLTACQEQAAALRLALKSGAAVCQADLV